MLYFGVWPTTLIVLQLCILCFNKNVVYLLTRSKDYQLLSENIQEHSLSKRLGDFVLIQTLS